jgi:hypothetical protein
MTGSQSWRKWGWRVRLCSMCVIYDARQFDPLFAAAFAQTLAFGLLLAREASEQPVDYEAWRHMPPEHALMRATLRVLSQEEIVRDVGVGFDVMLDTVNSFEAAI